MESKENSSDYLLTAKDLCDACSSRAYVYVEFESGELLFCLHHWKKHQNSISETAIEVLDESEQIQVI
jgi:hypothetical protein